jgi:HK97 family phage prohead protease
MPEDIVDPERIVREVTFAVGDGRTIEARIVPYNTDTKVVDAPHNGGTGVPYLERWLPGAFGKQVSAAHRVWLNVEHEPGFRAVVGHAVALREAPDALYGTFRVEPGSDGDKALHMVNEGVLTGLSIEAIPKKSMEVAGVVQRVKAILDKVSLVREGLQAYKLSEVLAVREGHVEEDEEPDPAPEPEPLPEPRTDEINERLQRLGYEPLVKRAISTRQWNGATSRFTDEEYERSALICRVGDAPPKERCSLPVLEPNGDLNTNALGAAAARLNQVTGITPAMRATAARKLVRYYRQADMEPPASLRSIASR